MQPLQTTILLAQLFYASASAAAPALDGVEHHYADSEGVKIHYVSLGEGPLVVMVHGFPDFWYSWRYQMAALAENYQVVALDQRGYNLSDKPAGQENYDTRFLVQDVAAVIADTGQKNAVLVGHDWGGHVAWATAMMRPDLLRGLVVMNLPHPSGFMRELVHNPEQQKNSEYARRFQQPDAHKQLTPEFLAGLVAKEDGEVRARYVEAFERSDMEALLHYYKQNYPRPPYEDTGRTFPPITVPVLQFHGLKDTALLHAGLNGTWAHIDAPYTLVTIPDAAHWVQHDAAEQVTQTLVDWLARLR